MWEGDPVAYIVSCRLEFVRARPRVGTTGYEVLWREEAFFIAYVVADESFAADVAGTRVWVAAGDAGAGVLHWPLRGRHGADSVAVIEQVGLSCGAGDDGARDHTIRARRVNNAS